jgi:hypothetical protein
VGLDLLTLAFERPAIDWHAIAPELVLLTAGCLITLVDIVFLEKARPYTAALAGIVGDSVVFESCNGKDEKNKNFAVKVLVKFRKTNKKNVCAVKKELQREEN